jgi:hypothetical protein
MPVRRKRTGDCSSNSREEKAARPSSRALRPARASVRPVFGNSRSSDTDRILTFLGHRSITNTALLPPTKPIRLTFQTCRTFGPGTDTLLRGVRDLNENVSALYHAAPITSFSV